MQADAELENTDFLYHLWDAMGTMALNNADTLAKQGVHKQIYNRIIEPFSYIDVILSTTDMGYQNWQALRTDKAAQPEIRHLAELMAYRYELSEPFSVNRTDFYHIPFFYPLWNGKGYDYILQKSWNENDYVTQARSYTAEQAIKISVSLCAQISFRAEDYSLEKAERIWERLTTSDPIHASPFEHIARPMPLIEYYKRKFSAWFVGDDYINYHKNFRGWKQLRGEIPNECKNILR